MPKERFLRNNAHKNTGHQTNISKEGKYATLLWSTPYYTNTELITDYNNPITHLKPEKTEDSNFYIVNATNQDGTKTTYVITEMANESSMYIQELNALIILIISWNLLYLLLNLQVIFLKL